MSESQNMRNTSVAIVSNRNHRKLAALTFDFVLCVNDKADSVTCDSVTGMVKKFNFDNENDLLPLEINPPDHEGYLGSFLENQEHNFEKARHEALKLAVKDTFSIEELKEIEKNDTPIKIEELKCGRVGLINMQLEVFLNNFCAHASQNMSKKKVRNSTFFCNATSYDLFSERTRSFETVEAILSNVPIISTEDLEWDQILDIRSDPEFRQKTMQFRSFIGKDYSGKDSGYIIDDIQTKLYEYKKASEKHGLELSMSVVKQSINSKSLIASFAASTVGILSGEPELAVGALSAGVALEVGKMSLTVAERRLEHRHQSDLSPISYLYEIEKKLGL